MNNLAEYYATFQNGQYLMHYGTIGQKWGVRNYQNKDGSLTPAGRERYYGSSAKREYGSAKDVAKQIGRGATNIVNSVGKGISVVGKKATDSIRSKAHDINENRKENAAYRKLQKEKHRELDRQFKKTFDKDTRSMTNEQLKTYTERLVAEKRYLDALKEYKKSDNTFSPLIEKGREKAFALIADAADKAIRKTLDDKYGLGLSGNKNNNDKQSEDKRSLIKIVESSEDKGIENLNSKEYEQYQKARGILYKEGILTTPDKKQGNTNTNNSNSNTNSNKNNPNDNKSDNSNAASSANKNNPNDNRSDNSNAASSANKNNPNTNKGSLIQIYKDGLKKGGMNMTTNEYKQWQNAQKTLAQMGMNVRSLNPKSQQKAKTDEKIMRYINSVGATKVSSIYRTEDDSLYKQMSAKRSHTDNQMNLDAVRSWKIQQAKRKKQEEAIMRKVDQYINWADVSF